MGRSFQGDEEAIAALLIRPVSLVCFVHKVFCLEPIFCSRPTKSAPSARKGDAHGGAISPRLQRKRSADHVGDVVENF